MTKGEIVRKHQLGFDIGSWFWKKTMLSMDEYAKEEAIAFLIWATKNYSIDYEGFSLNTFNDGRTTIFVKGQEITIDQFYDLFQSSKQSGGKEQVKA